MIHLLKPKEISIEGIKFLGLQSANPSFDVTSFSWMSRVVVKTGCRNRGRRATALLLIPPTAQHAPPSFRNLSNVLRTRITRPIPVPRTRCTCVSTRVYNLEPALLRSCLRRVQL